MTGTEPITDEEVARIRAAIERDAEAGAYHLNPDPAFTGSLVRGLIENERRYGYREDGGAIELVTIRLAATSPLTRVGELRASGRGASRRRRRMRFADGWAEAEVLSGEPAVGEAVAGPCALELPETTLLLPPGWRAEVDEAGTIVAARSEG